MQIKRVEKLENQAKDSENIRPTSRAFTSMLREEFIAVYLLMLGHIMEQFVYSER